MSLESDLLRRLIGIQLDTNKKVTDLCVMLYDLNKSNLDLNKTNYYSNEHLDKIEKLERIDKLSNRS